MTFEQWIEEGRLNASLPAYRRKKQEAINICIAQLEAHKAPYLALSGGKDSVAMAMLVDDAARQCGKDFALWLHYSDASFPGTMETCREVERITGRHLDVFESTTAMESIDSRRRQAFGKTGVFFASVREYAQDKDLAFVGVRGYESRRRMQAAKAHGMVFHSASMGDIDVVNPLQWFRLVDVASLLYEYDAPIHPIYRKFCTDMQVNANGEPLFIRLGYVTSKDLLDKGTAVFLQTNYPEIYGELMHRFPEIRNYA